nr:DUF6538 domain-containing protein [Amylibacter sp.]
MAGKIRHLVNRNGRYHARLVVPNELRGIIGKTELRMPLGGDRREALKRHPEAVTQLQLQMLPQSVNWGRALHSRPQRGIS